MKQPSIPLTQPSPFPPASNGANTSSSGDRQMRKPPTAQELIAHYESQGMDTKEASVKVIDDLQKALFKVITSKSASRNNDKFFAETWRKLDTVNTRLMSLDMKLESKPGYGEAVAIGLGTGVALRGFDNVFPRVAGAFGQIWNAVRSADVRHHDDDMIMNSSTKKSVAGHLMRQRYITSRLWWVTTLVHHKPKALNLNVMAKPRRAIVHLEYFSDMESLIAGKSLSDGPRIMSGNGDVPKGSLAVYVGPELRRYVVPASCLSMPDFRGLMDKAAEEFGFQQEGGLRIPCDEYDFEDILSKCLAVHQAMSKGRQKRQ